MYAPTPVFTVVAYPPACSAASFAAGASPTLLFDNATLASAPGSTAPALIGSAPAYGVLIYLWFRYTYGSGSRVYPVTWFIDWINYLIKVRSDCTIKRIYLWQEWALKL